MYSCTSPTSQSLSVNLESVHKETAFSDIINQSAKVEFIPLETNDDILIGNMPQIKLLNEILYVNDFQGSKSFCCFNSNTGEYLQKIGMIGKGMGELLHFHDFIVKNDHVLLADFDMGKIVEYSEKGAFIDEYELESPFPSSFEIADSNSYWFYFDAGQKSKHMLKKVNHRFKTVDNVLLKDRSKLPIEIKPFTNCNSIKFFHPPLSDVLYRIEDSHVIESVKLLGINDFVRSDNLYDTFLKINAQGFHCILKYMENESYIYIYMLVLSKGV